MKTDSLKGILELVGSGAVLVGLIFVGLELRQNTQALEAASLQNQTDASTNFLTLVASDGELARIWLEATADSSQLNEVDSFRYFMLARARWLRMQNAFLQWKRGMLTDDDWGFYEGLVCNLETNGAIQFETTWSAHRSALVGGFVEFVDDCWARPRRN